MNRLWDYEDYVNHLSHQNKIVRRWAFAAIENHFPNRYTDEVCNLIGDEVEHLACAAPRYLAMHEAVQHAPAILESFKTDHGNVPNHCAIALGNMYYEPALDVMLEYFSSVRSEETFLGILDYFGNIDNENCRAALKSTIIQTHETLILGSAVANLLYHHYPEDVTFVLDRYFDLGDRDQHYDTYLRNISWALGGSEYFRNLTEFPQQNILESPGDVIDNYILGDTAIELDKTLRENMIQSLKNGLYENFITVIMFEARSTVKARYSVDVRPDWLKEPYGQDSISLTLLEDLSKRSSIWKRIKDSKQSGRNLISLILSGYFAIKERGAYLTALSPDAGVEDLIWALKNSGPSLPKPIQKKITQMEPISELKNTLTEDLKTWGDIWTVRMMGRIGNEEFVPNLIHVLRHSDSLDYIYSDAIRAMNALDDSADEIILAAIKNKELEDWESFPILEYLPYAEAYDLALQRWEDEKNDMDSYELFAGCLRGIGDPRGIETLQYVYANENDATYIGGALECLSIIHNVEIPEMPDILSKRQEQEERQKARAKELNELATNYKQKKEQRMLEKGGKVIPFQRDSPKIGRNEPCPCGSGKKYKKCCLNKISSV
jgi:HEAT repeat protein